MGRKAKPTKLKELAGNPGKRPLNKREPRPPATSARVPRGRLPKEGARLWRELAKHLIEMGVMTEVDRPALEFLCVHYAVARAALKELAAGDLAVTTEGMQGVKKHPAATALKENSQLFKAYLAEFGLTPASRVRIKAEPVEKEKTLAEMLFEGVESE